MVYKKCTAPRNSILGRLHNIKAHSVESEYGNLIYLIDDETFVVYRYPYYCKWKVEDTPSEANHWIEPIRSEIIEIYNDIKDLKVRGINYWLK